MKPLRQSVQHLPTGFAKSQSVWKKLILQSLDFVPAFVIKAAVKAVTGHFAYLVFCRIL